MNDIGQGSTLPYDARVDQMISLIFRRCKTSPNIGKNPANSQNRFITQEGLFGTKCSTSLTNDIGDIPDACRTYMHLFKSSTQKLTKTV